MKRGEQRLSIKEFLAALKREYGIRRSRITVWRWCKRGLAIRDGSRDRLRLEHSSLGGIQTTLEAYERFDRKMSEARE